jgi:FAD:protein FMN transferase
MMLCSAHAGTLQSFEAVEPQMGTLFRIKLYAADQSLAEKGFRQAFDRIAQLNNILSDYKPDSELNRLTQAPAGKPVTVSQDLFRVLKASEDLAVQTNGAFDVTLGPVIRLWRQARKNKALPDSEALAAAKARCGYRKMKLDEKQHTVTLLQDGMLLDLGGIAKGYAADEALEVLKALGMGSALIAASGDLAFGDPPPGERGWRIGVDSYDRANAPFTRILLLSNKAVSTSGDTEQFVEINGVRYSHIIDPMSGIGLKERRTVTVVSDTGTLADALATALSVLGPEQGLRFLGTQKGSYALILSRPEKSGPNVWESADFRNLPQVSQ